MTPLNKPIRRVSDMSVVRDCGKTRRLVVSLYPNGLVGIRPEKTRREEYVTLEAVYGYAIKARVAKQQAERRKAKAEKRKKANG